MGKRFWCSRFGKYATFAQLFMKDAVALRIEFAAIDDHQWIDVE